MGNTLILFEPAYVYVVPRYLKAAADTGTSLFFCSYDKELVARYPDYVVKIEHAWSPGKILDALIEKYGQDLNLFTLNEIHLPILGEMRSIQKERYGVIYSNPEDVYLSGRSKRHMKEQWLKSNIKTPKARIYPNKDSLSKDISGFRYPLIIKPISGMASSGVFRVANDKELNAAATKIAMLNNLVLKNNGARDIGFVVEEFVEGAEFSVDTLWSDGTPITHVVLSRNKMEGPTFPDLLYYCDPALPAHIKTKIIQCSIEAVLALGIRSGNSHTELRVKQLSDNKQELYVIESTPRVGGAGLFSQLLDLCSDNSFTSCSLLVESASIRRTKPSPVAPMGITRSPSYFYCFIVPTNNQFGKIKKIRNLERLSRLPFIMSYSLLVTEGMYIGPSETNTGYWLVVTGKGNSYNNILRQIDEVMAIPILEF